MKDEIILALESSCDETSAAILKNGTELLSNIISTQIKTHMEFGGVMPEIASRLHLENIGYVLSSCFKEAKIDESDITAVAVTGGPGLIGALHVGVIAAKSLASYLKVPLINVHHLAGHIYANEFVKPFIFPLLAVVVSGGNSELVIMKDHLCYEIIGQTLDDAIGESLDKVARELGLPYPGGVSIDKLTQGYKGDYIKLPKVKVKGYNLSYSGLKSKLIRDINKEKENGTLDEATILKYAYSVEKGFVDQLLDKVFKAAGEYGVKQIVVGGGVSANTYLRSEVLKRGKGYDILIPPLKLTTDNAAMIAKAAHHMLEKNMVSPLTFAPKASRELGE